MILAGSKATIADLHALRCEGWDIDIRAHHRRGGRVLGLCGGYQMLGCSVADPNGVEGAPGSTEGLGLLDVETVLTGAKTLAEVTGKALDAPFAGYEMHMGITTGPDTARPIGRFDDGRAEGAMRSDGLVAGTYVHGLFGVAAQRAAWLAQLGVAASGVAHRASIETALDTIAAALEAHLDIAGLLAIARNRR